VAQVTLTGAAFSLLEPPFYLPSLISQWNTVAGDGFYNFYLFTNGATGPVFLNSGNASNTVGLFIRLEPGDHEFGYAAEGYNIFDNLQLSLFFNQNDDLRISAARGQDNSSVFAPYGSALSVVMPAHQVSLIAWRRTVPYPNLVGAFDVSGTGDFDTAGYFTLRVDVRPVITTAVSHRSTQPQRRSGQFWCATFPCVWSGLTTQAQRRRPRDAPIATATRRRRSLQRMVRLLCRSHRSNSSTSFTQGASARKCSL
jgi:hypothetical protein